MPIIEKLNALLRRRPPTEEELRGQAEAKAAREQMLQDRLSQKTGAGQMYRSGRR